LAKKHTHVQTEEHKKAHESHKKSNAMRALIISLMIFLPSATLSKTLVEFEKSDVGHCGDLVKIGNFLFKEHYVRTFIGNTYSGYSLTIWQSASGKTWGILLSDVVTNKTCVSTVGTNGKIEKKSPGNDT